MTKISSLRQYVAEAEDVCASWRSLSTSTHPWFRGQGDSTWELMPSLYRPTENALFEREMFRDFKLRATAYMESKPDNDLQWLFIMQHHGLPTRLLDWSESHLCALYFAVADMSQSKDAAVWILEPWSLNENTIGFHSVPSGDHEGFLKYTLKYPKKEIVRELEGEKPVALRPVSNTRRIVAQNGVFTIHGKETKSIDQIATESKQQHKGKEVRLERLVIDGASRFRILKELFLAGITRSTLFPDLDGLSSEIRFRYSKQYLL